MNKTATALVLVGAAITATAPYIATRSSSAIAPAPAPVPTLVYQSNLFWSVSWPEGVNPTNWVVQTATNIYGPWTAAIQETDDGVVHVPNNPDALFIRLENTNSTSGQ